MMGQEELFRMINEINSTKVNRSQPGVAEEIINLTGHLFLTCNMGLLGTIDRSQKLEALVKFYEIKIDLFKWQQALLTRDTVNGVPTGTVSLETIGNSLKLAEETLVGIKSM